MRNDFPFDANAVNYHPSNAFSLALASRLAYDGFEDSSVIAKQVIEFAKAWGFEEIAFFDDQKSDSQALLMADDEKIVVAFRGSEPTSWQDWFQTNINVRKVVALGGRVHSGFYRSFLSLWNPKAQAGVLDQMKLNAVLLAELEKASRPVWFTGHSLGGALATLAMASCVAQKIPVQGMYTYGQPRVGDWQFAEQVEHAKKQQMFRMVNNNDVVTRIPIFGYDHAGDLRYFDFNGQLNDGDDLTWWWQSWDRIMGRFDDLIDIDGIDDHSLAMYIDLLEKQLS